MVNNIINQVAQLSSIVLAVVWFDWKLGVIIFLVNWVSNTQENKL